MRFSVIIPVYNKADTIRTAIESVYAQTFDDYEIILVDDGSKDNLMQSLESVQSPKLRLIRQENGGVSIARNTGLANAQGDYVCFLDADDLWKPNHLEVLNGLITKYPESETYITSHEVIMVDGKIYHSSQALKNYDSDFETDDFLGLLNSTSYSVINSNSICIKRTMLQKSGIHFEPGVTIGEDTDVWYRLGLKNNVAVSKIETTQYRREYSTATRVSFHVYDWVFSRRVPDLLSDSQIPDNRKQSIIELMDRYNMTSSREYMLDKNRKEAISVLSKIKNKRTKRYVLTRLFTLLPYSLCGRILKNRY